MVEAILTGVPSSSVEFPKMQRCAPRSSRVAPAPPAIPPNAQYFGGRRARRRNGRPSLLDLIYGQLWARELDEISPIRVRRILPERHPWRLELCSRRMTGEPFPPAGVGPITLYVELSK